MTFIDIILLIVLAGFIFYGLFFGLIRTLGNLIGVIIGILAACYFYLIFFNLIQDLFFGFDNLGKIVCFLIIFIIINRLACFGFLMLDKTFNIISIIPFLKTINRLTGAVLGLIIGGLVLGLILYIAARYLSADSFFGAILIHSKVAPFLIKFVNILLPFLPEVLKKLKGII